MTTPMIALLVIDDDELDRKAVAHAVKALGTGYEMQEARDGRQGVDLAIARTFDCILVDYQLPDMNGLDLLIELRKRLNVAVPVVMLTGSGNESIAVEAMKRGASDYVEKPWQNERLLTILRLQVELRSARKHAERLGALARSTVECLGRSDALYHNLDHTVLVTLVGRDILRGRMMCERIEPTDYAHLITACLLHDISMGALIRVDLRTSQISRAQIAQNGISSIARSGEYLVTTSYDGGIYLVEPFSLMVANTIRAMTQRLRPPAAHAG